MSSDTGAWFSLTFLLLGIIAMAVGLAEESIILLCISTILAVIGVMIKIATRRTKI